MSCCCNEENFTLSDYGMDDLEREIKSRGWGVHKKGVTADDMIWRYKSGQVKEAMILLERMYPDMYGISEKVKG